MNINIIISVVIVVVLAVDMLLAYFRIQERKTWFWFGMCDVMGIVIEAVRLKTIGLNTTISVLVGVALGINMIISYFRCQNSKFWYWIGLFNGLALVLELVRDLILN